jgi:hypothetical protein
VDSLTAVFRTDFSGRGELAERQQRLNRFMASLTKLACKFNGIFRCFDRKNGLFRAFWPWKQSIWPVFEAFWVFLA